MEPGKKPPDLAQLGLSQIASIDNIDTARLALRWALERINGLQVAQQAATAQDSLQQSDILALRAREAMASLEAASYEAFIGRLEELDTAQFDGRVEQQRAAYRSARAALENDPSEAARRTIEDLSRWEKRFELWGRVMEGRLAKSKAQEAAQELVTQLSREAAVRPAGEHTSSDEKSAAREATLREQLARAQAQASELRASLDELPGLRERVKTAELACEQAVATANFWRSRLETLGAVTEQLRTELAARATKASAKAQSEEIEALQAMPREAERPEPMPALPPAQLQSALERAQQAEADLAQAHAELESMRAAAAAFTPALSVPTTAASIDDAPADAQLQQMAARFKAVSKSLRRILMEEEEIE